jgi:hypothetical protein
MAGNRRAWYLLVHQLPPEPLYLRAKVRQRLAKVGAVPLKGSVYALPRRDDCLEDFEWIAEEARAGGGEAWVCEAALLDRDADEALAQRSRGERDADYAALAREVRGWVREPAAAQTDLGVRLARARKRLEEIARIDFFRAKGKRATEALIDGLRERLERSRETMKSSKKTKTGDLVGRKWVTRRGVKVDRISSAWFVRRFVDPKARFRFIDPKTEKARSGEIGFDMVGGEFTHEGDRCTLETLIRSTRVRDRALEPIAQIVHDIDVKDGKYGRPEVPGVERLLSGLLSSYADDKSRLDRGFAIFDDLYGAFRTPAPNRRGRTATSSERRVTAAPSPSSSARA